MNLDDAIKHCEEIAMDKTNLAQTLWDSKEKARCEECAEEHNQLAQWLIELKMLKTEQEPSVSEIPNNCEMRDVTLEERESIDKYIKSISKPTGVKYGALEQEPSGDLISRKALISHIEKQSREWGEDYDAQQILGDIEDMPSVKPQEPGHWIIMGDRYIKCSECGHITKTESPDIYNFCMVCGANMSEIPTGSKPEISSYYGLRSYVGERSEE